MDFVVTSKMNIFWKKVAHFYGSERKMLYNMISRGKQNGTGYSIASYARGKEKALVYGARIAIFCRWYGWV